MWTPLLFIYASGLFVTGVTLYRTQIFKNDYLMHVGSIVLWPFYWFFYLLTLFQNRRRP